MADKSKDTGTGGINIDGKAYQMDTGLPNADGGAQGDWSPGDIAVDKTVKDITVPTRETFAKYLSKKTLAQVGSATHPNAYPVGVGDSTVNTVVSVKDADGNPTRPGVSSNEARFNPAFNTSIAPPAPAGMKKGLLAGSAQDGNVLLPSATTPAPSGGDYVKSSGGLKEPIKGYTDGQLSPNINTYESIQGITSNDIDGRPLRHIPESEDVTTVGGSSNIFKVVNPLVDSTLGLREATDLANRYTKGAGVPGEKANKFAVDKSDSVLTNTITPITIDGYPLSPTDAQQNIKNSEHFNSPLPSTYTDAYAASTSVQGDPFALRRGKSPLDAVDGNELLPNAAAPAQPGGPYVKPSGPVFKPIETYTNKVLEPNLRDSNSQFIDPGTKGFPPTGQGAWPLNVVTNPELDKGTSQNILSPDAAHELTLMEAAQRGSAGTYANRYPVDDPQGTPDPKLPELSSTADVQGYPLSPADAQDNPKNSKYYTLGRIFQNSYTTAAGQLEIKRGRAPGDDKDGNDFLPDAAKPADAGGSYVKSSKGLQDYAEKYTKAATSPNVYAFDKKSVSAEGPEFYGPTALHAPAEFNEYTAKQTGLDPGTFDPTLSNPSSRAITKDMSTFRAMSEVWGKGGTVPGEIANYNAPAGILEPVEVIKIADSVTGLPISPTDSQGSNANPLQYIEGQKLPSSYSDEASVAKLNDSIKRGKSSNEGPNGNELLLNAAEKAPAGGMYVKKAGGDGGPKDGPIKDYVSAVLKKNRFSNSKKFLPSTNSGSPDTVADLNVSDAGNETFMLRNAFVKPDLLKLGESPGNDDETPRDYNFRRLTRIGSILQLRATGEIQALADESTDPRDNLTQLAALAPGVGQIGAGVPLPGELLNIENIILNLPQDEDSFPPDIPIYEGQLIEFSNQFEGVINSVFEKFSSFTAIGMLATASLLVSVVVVLIGGLGLLFGFSSGSRIDGAGGPKRASTPEENIPIGRHGLGSYYGAPIVDSIEDILLAFVPVAGDSSVLLRFFGIQPTRTDFSTAVNNGLLAFFGVDEDFNPVSSAQAPGFYIVMARAIIRSGVSIALEFYELGKLFATGNVFSAIEQIFEILYTIKKSRFVASLNIFGQLGDAFSVSTVGEGINSNHTIRGLDASLKISDTDNIPNDHPMAAYSKNRLDNGNLTLKLAWSTNRTPDVLVLNKNSAGLSADTSLGSGRLLTEDPYQRTRFELLDASGSLPGARIPTEKRIAFESQFDSEYVPFYFHDLRTNELLGFHAFLTNLTDDYSATYESNDGFGRIDPVKTYKNTTRKISLGFVIAALDDKDFDSMWLKINKLTTLVYPQYTEGKRIILQNSSFVKPFTQMVGAAPMVRMRIGNLITSNYSKFNLASVFGLSSAGISLNGKKSDTIQDAVTKISGAKNKVRYKAGYQFKVKEKKYNIVNNETGFLVGKIDISRYPNIWIAEVIDNSFSEDFTAGPPIIKIKLTPSPSAKSDVLVARGKYAADVEAEEAILVDDTTAVWVTPAELLEMTEDTYKQFLTDLGVNSSEYATEVRNFLNEETNVITRSFKSAGGKGLAGFIDSINFDWLNQVTWDIETNRKAPKMCKVTMSFTPIHDISPGLDANGYNRAPIYPLGPYAPPKVDVPTT